MMFAAAALALLATIALALIRAAVGPTLFDRAQAANTVGTVATLLLAATVCFRLDNVFASRILPYAVNELHVAEVGGVLVTQLD